MHWLYSGKWQHDVSNYIDEEELIYPQTHLSIKYS